MAGAEREGGMQNLPKAANEATQALRRATAQSSEGAVVAGDGKWPLRRVDDTFTTGTLALADTLRSLKRLARSQSEHENH